MVALALVCRRTVRVGGTALVGGSDLERSSVLALQFGAEQLAVGRGLEVVVVSERAVVCERDATTLLCVVVVSECETFRLLS